MINSHKVHNRIDAGGIHAERAFGNRGCGGAEYWIGSCAAPGGLGGPGSKFRRLRLQQIAGNSCSGVSAVAARSRRTSETIEGMRQRWRSFSSGWSLPRPLRNFHSGGGHIVFRTQGDDGYRCREERFDELESRGAHQTVGSIRRATL